MTPRPDPKPTPAQPGAAAKRTATVRLADTIRHAVELWRPHAGAAAVLLAVLAVPQGYKAFFAYSQRLLVDGGILGRNGPLMVRVLAALAVGFLLAGAAQLLADYLRARASAAIINGVREKMFHHLQRLSMGYFARVRAGDVVARFTSDLADIQKSLTTRVVDAAFALLGLVINIPVAFALEWRLALVMLAGLPLVGIGTRLFGGSAAAARYRLKQEEGALAASVQENVRAQAVVKVFGLRPWVAQRFAAQLASLEKRFTRADFLAEVVGTSSSLAVLAVQVLVLGVGAYLAVSGRLSPGTLVAFLSLHAIVSKDIYDLTKKVVPALIASAGGLQRIEEITGEPIDVREEKGARPLPPGPVGFRLEEVTFAYPGGKPVLERVSLEIPAGRRVALVGGSGSGKSTVLGLLLRFFDPQGGRVLVNGVDLRSVSLESFYARVGVVFQESFLFDGTVWENIALGKLGAGGGEVQAAARAAELHDAIVALPQGYDTPVGEQGGRLSGGQRQRLAIARAILRNPAVLLLDEATSALDPATESAINATLSRLAVGRTVVTVTHRLAAACDADLIVVLDHGRVAEIGNHAELLARGGVYAALWTKQSGVEVRSEAATARGDTLAVRVRPHHLRSVPLLAGVEEAALADLAARMVVENWEAGRVVVREGEVGDRFFVIARGRVEVTLHVGGTVRHMAALDDGDFFGEQALLAGARRTATVRTLTPCLLLVLERSAFEEVVRAHPTLQGAVEEAAARRLARTRDLHAALDETTLLEG